MLACFEWFKTGSACLNTGSATFLISFFMIGFNLDTQSQIIVK